MGILRQLDEEAVEGVRDLIQQLLFLGVAIPVFEVAIDMVLEATDDVGRRKTDDDQEEDHQESY